jgi:hypothetical protein
MRRCGESGTPGFKVFKLIIEKRQCQVDDGQADRGLAPRRHKREQTVPRTSRPQCSKSETKRVLVLQLVHLEGAHPPCFRIRASPCTSDYLSGRSFLLHCLRWRSSAKEELHATIGHNRNGDAESTSMRMGLSCELDVHRHVVLGSGML